MQRYSYTGIGSPRNHYCITFVTDRPVLRPVLDGITAELARVEELVDDPAAAWMTLTTTHHDTVFLFRLYQLGRLSSSFGTRTLADLPGPT